MTAINAEALSKYVGILEVAPKASPTSFVRVASVRGLNAAYDPTANLVEVKADDTGTVYKASVPEIRFEGEFLENADRDIIKLLVGGTSTDVAGTLVSGETQDIASPIVADRFYALENQNGDGTAPTVNSVTGSVDGALTAHDDYQLVSVDGVWGIIFNTVAGGSHLTTLTQTVEVDYDYTPNATEQLVLTAEATELPLLVARITATEGSDIRRLTLSECTFEGVYNLNFLDVVEAGDITGTEFVLKVSKGATMTYENQIL